MSTTRTHKEVCISVASLVSNAINYEGYLGKDQANTIFDALAEGLIQQDVRTADLLDIESLLIARSDVALDPENYIHHESEADDNE